jgi:hypothetical protein
MYCKQKNVVNQAIINILTEMHFFRHRLYRERLTQIETKLTEVRAGRAQVILIGHIIDELRLFCKNDFFLANPWFHISKTNNAL